MTLLIDPGLLEPPNEGSDSWSKYWIRLMDWTTDRRVRVGIHTFELATHELQLFDVIESDIANYPPHTRHDRRRALHQLMSRVQQASSDRAPGRLHPEHLVSARAAGALAADLSRCQDAESPVEGVASDRDCWAEETFEGVCIPPPPSRFEICLTPEAPLQNDTRTRLRALITGKRVCIVGGQQDPRVEQEVSELGAEVVWFPCERHKKPNLERWRALRPDQDIAVCITGRIGHATSNKASEMARKCGVVYVEAYQVGDILAGIEEALLV